jgi:hypothetical protein
MRWGIVSIRFLRFLNDHHIFIIDIHHRFCRGILGCLLWLLLIREELLLLRVNIPTTCINLRRSGLLGDGRLETQEIPDNWGESVN